MAVWSEASNQIAIESGRIDAEFFHPVFLDSQRVLNSRPVNPVSKDFHISDGNHLEMSRHFTDGADSVPYFRGQDLNAFFLRGATPVRIPRSVYERANMRRSHFLPEDVLICIVGASTGTIALVSGDDTPCTASCKIGMLRKRKNAGVDPYFLSAFLGGKYGQFQIRRHSRGTAQGGLILKDIFKLLVAHSPSTPQNGFQCPVCWRSVRSTPVAILTRPDTLS